MTISRPAIYDINEYLKSDSTLTSIAGKEMSFYPIIGDGDDNGPLVVYYINPGIPSVESWWNRYDVVEYIIFDTDIDRLLRIGERFIEILSKGDEISQPNGAIGVDTRILSTYFIDANLQEAMEKDGWFRHSISFSIHYVKRSTPKTNVATKITSQTGSVTAQANTAVSFSVTTIGTSVTYQWQSSTNGGSTWSNIANATANIYTFTAQISDDGKLFRIVASGDIGSDTSAPADLIVLA